MRNENPRSSREPPTDDPREQLPANRRVHGGERVVHEIRIRLTPRTYFCWGVRPRVGEDENEINALSRARRLTKRERAREYFAFQPAFV